VEDILEESHHGRAIGVVIGKSDLEAKDGIGIWAWWVLEALAKELAGMRTQTLAVPLRTNNTPVQSKGSSGTGATYRPLGLACFRLALQSQACQCFCRRSTRDALTAQARTTTGVGSEWRDTYKSRHSFCRAKARERKGMICACCSARSDHRSRSQATSNRGVVEPAERYGTS
jgi:hypothetical protein